MIQLVSCRESVVKDCHDCEPAKNEECSSAEYDSKNVFVFKCRESRETSQQSN